MSDLGSDGSRFPLAISDRGRGLSGCQRNSDSEIPAVSISISGASGSTQAGPSKPKTYCPMTRPQKNDLNWERQRILTNLFEFDFDESSGVVQFKVKFEPVSETRRRNIRSLSSLSVSSSYDGNEYIHFTEDVSQKEFAVYLQKTRSNYKIKIESSSKLPDFTDSDVLKNHINRLYPLMKMLALQRKLPSLSEDEWFELKSVSKRGLTSVGHQLQPRINTGVAICYMKGCVADFALRFITSSVEDICNEPEMIELEKALRGCIVEANHGRHLMRYKVASFSRQPCGTLTFTRSKSGTVVTVSEFYKNKGKSLARPDLPAIIAEGGQYLPMEICDIRPDLNFPLKEFPKSGSLNSRSLHTRFNEAKNLSPDDARRKSMVQGGKTTNFLSMAVGEQIEVEAHIIPPPAIQYSQKKNEATTPLNGRWNLGNMGLYEACTVSRIGILNCSDLSMKDILDFYVSFELVASTHDLDLPGSPLLISDKIQDFKGRNIQLLLVILPRKSRRTNDTDYDHLKARCEHDLHCRSQFLQAESLEKYVHNRQEKYVHNRRFLERLALQINAKCGASNHSVADSEFSFDDDTIILGADVTHPSTGDRFCCSVACLVGSLDFPRLVPYKAVYSAQTGEIIKNIGDMFREILLTFKRKRGHFPRKVIYFRDGISNKEFSSVMEIELTAIYSAYEALVGVRPFVTCIVCQKRGRTRLFKVTGTEGDVVDASPGTIVDEKICEPDKFDFYMLSHATEKGTGRAVHYTVLQDDSNHGCKALYSLTHNLCYMHAAGTDATSMAAPLLYAHKAAFRTRSYLNDRLVVGEGKVADVADVEPLLQLGEELRDTMYYL